MSAARSADPRIAAYLDALDRRLAHEGHADREEVRVDVEEHIRSAVAELGRPATDAELDAILVALGPADEIARDGHAPAGATASRAVPIIVCAVLAVAIPTIVVPPFDGAGWLASWALLIAGVVLACVSPRWPPHQSVALVVLALGACLAGTQTGRFPGFTPAAPATAVDIIATVVAATCFVGAHLLTLGGLRDRPSPPTTI